MTKLTKKWKKMIHITIMYWKRIIFFNFLVNFVLKFIVWCIYMQGRLLIVLIAALIVEDAQCSNVQNWTIAKIANRVSMIKHHQSPIRDYSTLPAWVCFTLPWCKNGELFVPHLNCFQFWWKKPKLWKTLKSLIHSVVNKNVNKTSITLHLCQTLHLGS